MNQPDYVDKILALAARRPPPMRSLTVAYQLARRQWRHGTWARPQGSLVAASGSVSHLLRALETFNSLGVAVSLSEQLDTTTPAGKMVFTLLGAVAELERRLIAERVRAGLRNARRQGKQLGRPTRGD